MQTKYGRYSGSRMHTYTCVRIYIYYRNITVKKKNKSTNVCMHMPAQHMGCASRKEFVQHSVISEQWSVIPTGFLKYAWSRNLTSIVKACINSECRKAFFFMNCTLNSHRSRVIIPSEPLRRPVLLSLSGGRLLESPGR